MNINQLKSLKLKVFDGNLIEDALGGLNLKSYGKNNRKVFYIMFVFIMLAGLMVFLMKLPARLVADLKNICRDFLNLMERGGRP